MARVREDAICIRHLEWSETSQIVVLLTRGHGKLRGLAKGSRRTSPAAIARFSGGIDLLTRGEVVAIIRPSSDLATLTEWDLQEPHRHLRRDLRAQRMALYAADLANALLAEHDAHPRAFAAMERLLQELAEPAQREAALLRFQWRLLDDCGYRPELHRDARTGQPLPEAPSYAFDPQAGGLRTLSSDGGGTGAHASDARGPWRVRRETVEVLRTVAGEAPPTDQTAEEASPAAGADAAPPEPAPPEADLSEAGTRAEAGPPEAGGRSEAAAFLDDAAVARANRLLCVYARAILDRDLPTMALILGEGG